MTRDDGMPVQRTVPANGTPLPVTTARRSAFDIPVFLGKKADDASAQALQEAIGDRYAEPTPEAVTAGVARGCDDGVGTAPRSGARDDRPSPTTPVPLDAGVEKRPADPREPDRLSRPVHGDGGCSRSGGKGTALPAAIRMARWSDGAREIRRGVEVMRFSAEEWAQIRAFDESFKETEQ